jgi:hypothetical protein
MEWIEGDFDPNVVDAKALAEEDHYPRKTLIAQARGQTGTPKLTRGLQRSLM